MGAKVWGSGRGVRSGGSRGDQRSVSRVGNHKGNHKRRVPRTKSGLPKIGSGWLGSETDLFKADLLINKTDLLITDLLRKTIWNGAWWLGDLVWGGVRPGEVGLAGVGKGFGWGDSGLQRTWRVGGAMFHGAGRAAWVEGIEAAWRFGAV